MSTSTQRLFSLLFASMNTKSNASEEGIFSSVSRAGPTSISWRDKMFGIDARHS